jgi:magnesium transporter
MRRSDRERNEGRAALVERGRRLVAASAEIPREALRFLGRPTLSRRRGPPSGSPPGVMVLPADAPEPTIRVMLYGPDRLDEHTVETVAELSGLLAATGGSAWIDIEGFGNVQVLEQVGEALGIHPLAMADVVHVPQRPKAELHDGRLLVVTQMARMSDAGEVDIEQVSLVLGPGWVVTFQEQPGDLFDPVRARIRAGTTRIRSMGAEYLTYALIDAVIDSYFAVIEALGGVIDALEEEVIQNASRATLARIQATRRTLLALHRVQWGQRDALSALLRDEELPFSEAVKPYLRDAHDHAFQTLNAIEGYRDMAVALTDLYLSNTSQRLNEVMKTLTIMATIFIPLSFVTGVYGMNFDHMPELHWRWGYPGVWALMVAVAAGLALWFWGRGWLGGEGDDDGG